MKLSDTPRYRIRWKGQDIGVSTSSNKAIYNMQIIMGCDVHTKNFKNLNQYDVYDSKTSCVLARSRDYEPLL